MIETNIDDMNPELYPVVINKLLELGALDVTITPALMKKGRPGCILQLLSPAELEHQLGQVIFEETSAIGYRIYPARRQVLKRVVIQVETCFGNVAVKIAHQASRIMNIAPEYEDCIKLAQKNNIAVKAVYNMAIKEAYRFIKQDLI
ncbi:nickel insertion protein [Peptococcaceae bacterium 1198_IL3148]